MPRRKLDTGKTSLSELLFFVLIIVCVYFILSLFGSSIAGESGIEWGKYLRENWGGAVIILLLFVIYLCVARFMRFRIPKIQRQILGTIQLYISLSFMLGYLRETGWQSEFSLFQPGKLGLGLAKFFVLNTGTFITLILICLSFIFSMFLYGSKILAVSLPSIKSVSLRRNLRRTRKHEASYKTNDDEKPEDILFADDIPEFTKNIPAPILKPSHDYVAVDDDIDFSIKQPEPPRLQTVKSTLESIDDAIAIIDAKSIDTPPKKIIPQPRLRKMRRPLPELSFPQSKESLDKENNEIIPEKKSVDEAVFPPPIELFGEKSRLETSRNFLKDNGKQGRTIINTLKNFSINASIAQTTIAPAFIQYKLELASGTKISRISGLDEEIAMDLAVMNVRIEAPILGTHYVGVEVPNPDRKFVSLRTMIESGEYINAQARLPLILGMRTGGRVFVKGLEDLSNLLITGSSGSGKKTFINSCIMSLCGSKTPKELRLLLIDTSRSDFSVYEGLPHLLAQPVNDIKSAKNALNWACNELEKRNIDFSNEKARNIEAYNRKLPADKKIPEILIIINDLADLIYSDINFSELIVKLARKSGNAGIYLFICTSKPSVDILNASLKNVVPARVVFALSAVNEAKNVLDNSDAMKLTGKGDMLFVSAGNPVAVRLQAPLTTEQKIIDFVDYMHNYVSISDFINFS